MKRKFLELRIFVFLLTVVGAIVLLRNYTKSNEADLNLDFSEKTPTGSFRVETSAGPGETKRDNAPRSRKISSEGQESEAEAQKKIVTLREILRQKNDNDPRIDSDFKSLSDRAKFLLRTEYKSMASESFNEKGTIVFLLGRNLSNTEDFDFLNSVLAEPPCQSLGDCSSPAAVATGEASHTESINQLTLVYPQIVSIKAAENYLTGQAEGAQPLAQQALKTLEIGAHSNLDTVAQEARGFLRRYQARQ